MGLLTQALSAIQMAWEFIRNPQLRAGLDLIMKIVNWVKTGKDDRSIMGEVHKFLPDNDTGKKQLITKQTAQPAELERLVAAVRSFFFAGVELADAAKACMTEEAKGEAIGAPKASTLGKVLGFFSFGKKDAA